MDACNARLWRLFCFDGGENMANLPYDKSVFYKEIVEIKEALKDIAEILREGLLSEKETDVPEREDSTRLFPQD